MLRYIIEGDDSMINLIQYEYDYISSVLTPKIFDHMVANNIVDQIDKSFIRLCTSLESNGISNPKLLPYYEFNAKIDYFEEVRRNKSGKNQNT